MPLELADAANAEEQAGIGAEALGFTVGQRIHAAGNPRRTGTIRHVGPVEGHGGIWIGVEWDDGEGKHDGIVNGVRYFTTKGPRSGSFVRPTSLSAGISFLEALHLRYRGESSKEEEDLNELDLTGNLLSKWQDVSSICEALPALTVLNLTSNLLEGDVVKFTISNGISVLVLNNCGVTWEKVETLKQSLLGIQELHLMGNNLKTLMPLCSHISGFDSLRILNLEDNHIDEWDEVLKLYQLSRLEQLHLNKNKLKQIFYPLTCSRADAQKDHDTSKCSMPFQNLHCLLLGYNEIEDLASVDSLNLFPNLLDIRLSENPVTDPARGGVPRFVLIARLSKVEMLNGSEVTSRERRESEIRYVRLVMAKMQFDDPEKIKRLHPRFSELKMRHGIEDEKPSSGIAVPQKMSTGLLSVTLKCIGASMGEKPPVTKRLPATILVGKLKVLCESFFKLNGIKLRLFLQEEGSPLPLLLDDEMASLVDLGIGTDATILVDEAS